MKKENTPILLALWQVPLLAVLAGLIALAVNHWRDAPLPLIGDWSVKARFTDESGQSPTIPLDEAKQLFQDKAAKFLDARPPSQYAEGHIGGAFNLPWQDATNIFPKIAERLDDKDTIITYCDGESCELSHDLSLFLKDMGFADVRVLVNGWTLWRDAGLPTEKAGAAHEN